MHTRILSLLATGLLTVFCSAAFAADCGTPTPHDSPIWKAYFNYVKDNYLSNGSFDSREYAFGHALGRVASAVRENPEKAEAFACIEYGLKQQFGFDVLFGYKDIRYKRAMEAAMGMHDERVARDFKVSDTSPLDAVFAEALAIAGRTSYGAGTTPPGKGTGTIIKADPAGMFGTSSTAPSASGTDSSCIVGDRWSLATARSLLSSASESAQSVGASCASKAWTTCRAISSTLHEARDHIFQVFDQNHDGVANCRLCNYDEVLEVASLLITWEEWLGTRYYDASGLSTIYHTIKDNSSDPLCQANSIPPQPVTGADGPASGAGGSQIATHACADVSVPTDATWLFYRWGLGGGGAAYPEKQGLICYGNNYYYTYRGDSMEGYQCTGNWEDCKAVVSDVYPYTDIKTNADGSKNYEYSSGYGARKPAN